VAGPAAWPNHLGCRRLSVGGHSLRDIEDIY
jgi:hypothetical protein